MELVNGTRMVAGFSLAMDPSGREVLVIVVKGTFRIPSSGQQVLQLHDEQVPLVLSDTFSGEPGFSAPRYEVDFAPRKPRCDLLLNGSAHAPTDRLATRVNVALSVGAWTKSFAVIGKRVWEAGLTGIKPSSVVPFETMPISYDSAFGGTDAHSPDPSDHAAFMPNPVGRGFHKHLRNEWIDGSPLPNTEELGNPVTWVNGNYRPMSFGVVGRNWEPRYRLAGTYDQLWVDEVAPFLAADFDDRYYQAAAVDQQLPLPLGGQQVTLINLTPDRRRTFVLPNSDAPVHVFPKKGQREDYQAVMDTIVVEPDLDRVTITWRTSRPLRKSIFEIAAVLVGRKSRGWWRARETGKSYYPSIGELARRRLEDELD